MYNYVRIFERYTIYSYIYIPSTYSTNTIVCISQFVTEKRSQRLCSMVYRLVQIQIIKKLCIIITKNVYIPWWYREQLRNLYVVGIKWARFIQKFEFSCALKRSTPVINLEAVLFSPEQKISESAGIGLHHGNKRSRKSEVVFMSS